MPSEPKRILIVEDDKGLAELFGDLLAKDGALCSHVENGRLCLEWLAAHPADLLLIDYSLPDLLAPALVEALRDAGRRQPFIVVTGHGDERVAVAMMKLGARDYLVKDSLVLDRLPSVVKRTLQELDNERRLAASEAALQAETRRADQYFENAAVMMIVLDRDGRVQRLNRVGCEILGLPASEVLGRNWFECFIPTKGHDHVRDVFQRLVAGQLDLSCHVENTVLNRAGEERLLAWHHSLIRDDKGAIVGVLGSAEDITERRQAEAAQREHDAFRKRIFESSQIPIIVMEAHGYHYIDCNPAAVAICRCASRAELLGHTPLDFSAPVQYDGTPAPIKARFYIERALAEGRVVFEWLHQRADGELWDGEVHLMSFTSNDRRFLQFTVQDVTERRRAATALRENKERFAAAFRNSPISTTIRDVETGCYLDVNERCLSLLGYARDEIVGHPSADIGWMTDADREENQRLLKAQGNVVDRELHLRRKDGATVICSYSAHVIPMAGRTCVFSTMIDITERRRAEEALRESEKRLRLALSVARMGYWRYDIATGLLRDYEGHGLLYGVDSDGRHLTLEDVQPLVHPEDRAAAALGLQQTIAEGVPFNTTYRTILPGGEVRWLHSAGQLYRDAAGNPNHVFGVTQDITELKQAEELLREKMAELQRWQTVTLGREGRVLELKGEINELLHRLGEPPRYPSQVEDPAVAK